MRTLSKAELGYSHLEKEATICVIKRFHKYIFGREFTVFSDHLPVKGLFGHDKQTSTSAAAYLSVAIPQRQRNGKRRRIVAHPIEKHE